MKWVYKLKTCTLSVTMTNYDVVIYHGHCPDGISGAWVYWRITDSTEFFPGKHYGKPPFDLIDGKEVLFIDFTYPVEMMLEVIKVAKFVRVLDHHISSKPLIEIDDAKFSLRLDTSLSGCQLAWQEFHPDEPIPWFLNDIADRDLWTYKIDNSKAVNRAFQALGVLKSIESFEEKIYTLVRKDCVDMGKVLLNDDYNLHNNIADRSVVCKYKDYVVNVVECSEPHLISDVGDTVLKKFPCDFSAMYRYNMTKNCFSVSLRSRKEDDVNVAEIAAEIANGGGHKNAAGFVFSGEKPLNEFFVPVS